MVGLFKGITYMVVTVGLGVYLLSSNPDKAPAIAIFAILCMYWENNMRSFLS